MPVRQCPEGLALRVCVGIADAVEERVQLQEMQKRLEFAAGQKKLLVPCPAFPSRRCWTLLASAYRVSQARSHDT